MMNIIKKECPTCKNPDADILCALLRREDGKMVSYNVYRCMNKGKKHQFRVLRKGDIQEQALTEKYIISEKIKLD